MKKFQFMMNAGAFPQFPVHTYEIRPRKDKRGVDLISDALPFGRLSYGEPMQSVPQSFTAVYMML